MVLAGVAVAALQLAAMAGACQMAAQSDAINVECCDEPSEDCSNGFPRTCNAGCAALFLPFWRDCQAALGPHAAANFRSTATQCRASAAAIGGGTEPVCKRLGDTLAMDLSLAANDTAFLYWDAVTFKHCCPPHITAAGEVCQGGGDYPGCTGSCSLEYADSWLARKFDSRGRPLSSGGANLWAEVWNSVMYEIQDLNDILVYLAVHQLPFMSICGHIYSKAALVEDLLRRSQQVLTISAVPQWDAIRLKMMVGVCEPLDDNFASERMDRVNYCWHFHAASAVEGVARFVRVARQHQEEILVSEAVLDGLHEQTEMILRAYWEGWSSNDNGSGTYLVPAESEYSSSNYSSAYNQAASISMAYLELWEAGNATWRSQQAGDQFRDRAVAMGAMLHNAPCPKQISGRGCYAVWSYDPKNDRTEDPDHATEDLRLAIRLSEMDDADGASLFSKVMLARMLKTWFSLGLSEGADCLTSHVDSSCSPCNATKLVNVASRNLFVLRYHRVYFEKYTAVRPFVDCTVGTACTCNAAGPHYPCPPR